jgi:ribosomal protein S4E
MLINVHRQLSMMLWNESIDVIIVNYSNNYFKIEYYLQEIYNVEKISEDEYNELLIRCVDATDCVGATDFVNNDNIKKCIREFRLNELLNN